jgi:hypothetical protein
MFQFSGRIRRKEGKEVIISPGEDFENENQNILRQYYMKEAIKQVIDLDLTKLYIFDIQVWNPIGIDV